MQEIRKITVLGKLLGKRERVRRREGEEKKRGERRREGKREEEKGKEGGEKEYTGYK